MSKNIPSTAKKASLSPACRFNRQRHRETQTDNIEYSHFTLISESCCGRSLCCNVGLVRIKSGLGVCTQGLIVTEELWSWLVLSIRAVIKGATMQAISRWWWRHLYPLPSSAQPHKHCQIIKFSCGFSLHSASCLTKSLLPACSW